MFIDQLDAVAASSKRRGTELDLSLLTDGLKDEREQGITIDVAYRYFFFFFKQMTAYEMRISDWSSDVCSSDLAW